MPQNHYMRLLYRMKSSKGLISKDVLLRPLEVYGKKEDYAWSFPARWFNMKSDPSVLIGNEFWDFIGGDGTYQAFIDEINSLGKSYRDRIYREFLEIEPPQNDVTLILR